MRTAIGVIGLALTLITIAVLTLSPVDGVGGSSFAWEVYAWLRRTFNLPALSFTNAERLANVLMFVPFGFFSAMLVPQRFRLGVIPIGIALTMSIEFSQQFIANRVSDPVDIVTNSIGGTIGVIIVMVISAIGAARRRVRARREWRERMLANESAEAERTRR